MRTEKVLYVIILLGLLLKLFVIPGGSTFIVFGTLFLSIIYFPLGFYFLTSNFNEKSTTTFSILSGFVLSTLLMGELFKLMYWPGAIFLLIVGVLSCSPIAIISYIRFSQPHEIKQVTFYRNMFVRVTLFIIFGLLLLVF